MFFFFLKTPYLHDEYAAFPADKTYIFRIKKSLKRYQMVNQKQSFNQRRTDSTMVKRKRTCGTRLSLLLLQTWWYVINEKRTGLWLRQKEHIRGHLRHIYSVPVNRVIVTTVNLSKETLLQYLPCKQQSSIKEIMIRTTSSGISDQLRDICTNKGTSRQEGEHSQYP